MPPLHRDANLSRFFVARYTTAHDLLKTDEYAAERIYNELLHNPRLPLWIRIQCNVSLAFLDDDIETAATYARDARHVLELFKESRTRPQPDSLQEKLKGLERWIGEAEQDIAYRREHPEEEDDEVEEEEEVKDEVLEDAETEDEEVEMEDNDGDLTEPVGDQG